MEELVDDIAALVKLFAKTVKTKDVFVKLEVLADNGCQFWHQDSVPFRLVTTYRGPCTEWVHPDLNKPTLRKRGQDAKEKHSLCHHDVALFKGRGETTHGDALLNQPGIVHRSPDAKPRFLLCVEPLSKHLLRKYGCNDEDCDGFCESE